MSWEDTPYTINVYLILTDHRWQLEIRDASGDLLKSEPLACWGTEKDAMELARDHARQYYTQQKFLNETRVSFTFDPEAE